MTLDYGFTTTDEVEFDKMGLPIGEYHAMATEEESGGDTNPNNPRPVVVTWEVLEGEDKGKTSKVWYNVHHTNDTTANIAKQSLKRIAEATNRAISASAPIKGRVCKLIVDTQKNDESRTEIKKYLPADENFEPEKEKEAPF